MSQITYRRLRRDVLPRLLTTLLMLAASSLRATSTSPTSQLERFLATESDECPTCDALFTQIRVSADGQRIQDTVLQVRGEPKSGTTFMFAWVRAMLKFTCFRFNHAFGENTCSIDEDGTLTFDPHLDPDDRAKCPCHNVDL